MNEVAKRETVERMPWAPRETTPMDMLNHAVTSGAGIEVLEKLMALQERWEANQGRKAFDQAIAEAKAEIPPIIKNREVDFTHNGKRTHYQFEDLAGIAKVVDPILSKHGLSYRYRSAQEGQTLTVTCILSHRDGYSEETSLSGPNDQTGNKNAHQGVGSAATYLQRYTLKLALGLAVTADDDGRAAEVAQTISEEQAATIVKRLSSLGIAPAKLAGKFGVETIADIPAAKFADAMTAIDLTEKQRKVREAVTDA